MCTCVLISILAIIRDIWSGSVVNDRGCGCLSEAKNACHFVVCVLMLLYGELQIYVLVNDSLIIFCKKFCGDRGHVLWWFLEQNVEEGRWCEFEFLCFKWIKLMSSQTINRIYYVYTSAVLGKHIIIQLWETFPVSFVKRNKTKRKKGLSFATKYMLMSPQTICVLMWQLILIICDPPGVGKRKWGVKFFVGRENKNKK